MKKKNVINKLIGLISAVVCAVTFCAGTVSVDPLNKVEAATSLLYYREFDNCIQITGYNKSLFTYETGIRITIPSEINGKPVTSINSSDFDGINQNYTKGVHISLTIPDSVISIYGIKAPSPLNTQMGGGIRFYCYENSYAYQYAINNNIEYSLLKRPVVTTAPVTTTVTTTTTTTTTIATTNSKYFTYREIDIDGDGIFDYIEITDCDEALTDVKIPSEINGLPVKSIGILAFYDHRSLKSVIIPDGVTSIGESAFYRCTNLSSVTIPASVTSIDDDYIDGVFDKCDSGLTIYCYENSCAHKYAIDRYINFELIEKPVTTTTIVTTTTTITTTKPVTTTTTTTMTKPVTTKATTITTTTNKPITTTIITTTPDCLKYKEIDIDGDGTFDYILITGCSKTATDIKIPNQINGIPVKSIGYKAFEECEKLKSIEIPNSVTSIGGRAFASCYDLTNVILPDSVTSIGDCTFYYCRSLKSIIIPDSVISIENSAFSNCSSLTNITIPNDITSIGKSLTFSTD